MASASGHFSPIAFFLSRSTLSGSVASDIEGVRSNACLGEEALGLFSPDGSAPAEQGQLAHGVGISRSRRNRTIPDLSSANPAAVKRPVMIRHGLHAE